jgi:hypothetical protein
MLHNKDIKNLSELKLSFVRKHKKSTFFLEFISILKLGKLQAVFSKTKLKGISSLSLIRLMLVFPFIDQTNIYAYTKSYWYQFSEHGKDAYYRLKNNSKINWRSFLFGVIKLLLATIQARNTDQQEQDTITALIFDDTVTAKTGKHIEGTSRIWDHVIQKSVLGFQILVMGYYDGTMFIPIDFSIHRSKGRNKKKIYGLAPKHYNKQFKKKREANTPGFERKKELNTSKIEMAIKMIKRAVKHNITADYVLADSWFTCWKLVKEALKSNMNYIGMFSISKTLFTYRNKKLTYAQIRHLNRKKVKRNKRFNLYYIRTVVQWNGQNVVLIFTRKGKKGNWKTLISTDLSLNFNETIEIYQIRWTIEVFFKESKQSLRLGKSQSTDFDAQIADTTLVMVQYLFLALQNRVDKYETLGQLFKGTKENLLELRLHERLIGLLLAVIEVVSSLFEEIDPEEIMQKAINNDEALTKLLRLIDRPVDNHKSVA